MNRCPVQQLLRRLMASEGIDNPHPIYAGLRESAPLLDVPHFGATVTRYAEVRDTLFDRSMLVSSAAAKPGSPHAQILELLPPDLASLPPPLFLLDEPDHKRLRKLVAHAFSQRRIDALGPRIAEIALALIAQMPEGQDFDLVAALAVPLPAQIISEILGVNANDADQFRSWSQAVINELHPLASAEQREAAITAHRGLVAYFGAELEKRRANAHAGNGLLSDLAVSVFEDRELSIKEAISLCCNLVVAGHYTTTDLISNLTHLLLLHPEQKHMLCEYPSLWSNAVEEALRFEPPTPLLARICPHAAKHAGRDFEEGDAINVFIAAANRDPRAYEQPDRFAIDREEKPHLSFGGGAHFCLGAPLARAEARIAVELLFEKRPDLVLVKDENIVWRRSRSFRGLERLIVRPGNFDEQQCTHDLDVAAK